MLAKPLAACTYLPSIVSELYDASVRKSKNRYFYHILVSPGDALGAITLNVVWMEREFDAYKLSRCMCPSNYNRFWGTARYWSKIANFFIPLTFDASVRGVPVGIAPPRLVRKTRMAWLPDCEKISKISVFVLAQLTNVTDRQTDRRTDTACRHIPRLCIASRGKNLLHMWKTEADSRCNWFTPYRLVHLAKGTRSSAVAERPRDAPFCWKFC